MGFPITPNRPYYKLLDKEMDFQSWWKQYTNYQIDYLVKVDTNLFPYVLESSPARWYSRLSINMYTPVDRETVKFYLPLSLDYESLILGTALGYWIAIRHWVDHRQCKSTQLRNGQSFCTGRNNHFYLNWDRTHINPKKFVKYEKKLFWKKLLLATPYALCYGVISTFFCHAFFSQNFTWVARHFPLFVGTTIVTYDIYLYDPDYADLDFNFYKHPELYALAMLMLYSAFRWFRNYAGNIPFKRVIIG